MLLRLPGDNHTVYANMLSVETLFCRATDEFLAFYSSNRNLIYYRHNATNVTKTKYHKVMSLSQKCPAFTSRLSGNISPHNGSSASWYEPGDTRLIFMGQLISAGGN